MSIRSNAAERLPKPPARSDHEQRFREINERYAQEVLNLDPRDICLFLPHCLRSRSCPAESDHEGIQCRRCGGCTVGTITSAAEVCGVKVFCVPGGSLLEALVRKYRPRAVLGAACAKEILLAVELFQNHRFPLQVFPLEKEGCVETRLCPDPLLDLLAALQAKQTKLQENQEMKQESQDPSRTGGLTETSPVDGFWSQVIPREFDNGILAQLCGDDTNTYDTVGPSKTISEPLWDFLSRGGKGKRTQLFSLILQAFGKDEEPYRDLMLIPELSHNGTLIIDDIEDGSSHRRGKPCVHHIYGTDVAMNAGNVLYFLPLLPLFQNDHQIPEAKRNEIFQLYVQGMIRLHFGQSMDIAWHRGLLDVEEISEEKYLQMSGLKTGALYWMSARIAAVLADVPEAACVKLGEFAKAIGIAFQIKDDLLDLQGERFAEGKGGLGKDITEGKITLMVIQALKNAPREETGRLKEILSLHSEEAALIREAISILERCGAMAYAGDRAERIVRQAYRQVEPMIPRGPFKGRIETFADSLLNRDL